MWYLNIRNSDLPYWERSRNDLRHSISDLKQCRNRQTRNATLKQPLLSSESQNSAIWAAQSDLPAKTMMMRRQHHQLGGWRRSRPSSIRGWRCLRIFRNRRNLLMLLAFMALAPPIFFHFRLQRFHQVCFLPTHFMSRLCTLLIQPWYTSRVYWFIESCYILEVVECWVCVLKWSSSFYLSERFLDHCSPTALNLFGK